MPFLSFVVPIYKVNYDYLRFCADSILNQTLQDIELVLVDDGSPDDCGRICDEYAAKDARVRVVHKKNGGLSDARNAGTAVVTGEWVTYVDGDDWVETDFAAHFAQRLSERPAADVYIYSGYRDYATCTEECHPYYPDGTRFTTKEERESLQLACCRLFDKGKKEGLFIGSAWSKVYRTAYMRENNLQFTIVPYGEDSIFYFYSMEAAKCVEYVAYSIYHYRDTDGSMVNKYRVRADEEQDIYLSEIFGFAEKYQKSPAFVDDLYFRVLVAMQRCISQKFCHPDNPDSWWKRHRACRRHFSKEPYASLFRHIRFRPLNRNTKIKYILLRLHWYGLMNRSRNAYLSKHGRKHMRNEENGK